MNSIRKFISSTNNDIYPSDTLNTPNDILIQHQDQHQPQIVEKLDIFPNDTVILSPPPPHQPINKSSFTHKITIIASTVFITAPFKFISYIVYIIVYPFTFILDQINPPILENPIEQQQQQVADDLVTRSNEEDLLSHPNDDEFVVDEDDDEKTQLIKRDNLISNKIKSPTSFSKYIIPPPQRLYPLSRNPGKKRRKKILVLDLDETLIHSLSRGSPRSFHPTASQSKMIEIKLNNNITSLYYVHKRPFCDYFLGEISKWFELQIFTASVKEYADPIIDWLESDILDHKSKKQHNINGDNIVFTKRYYRNDCTYRSGVGYIKDLSKFIKDDELKNVMILDNSPISYALHEENAVMIEGWINDQSDRDLLNLLPLLHSLSLCIDVRYILGLKNGEKFLE